MKSKAKTELQKDVDELRESGKAIYESLGHIMKDLTWKDYLALAAAGAAIVYGYKRKEFIAAVAVPAVMGLISTGVDKAKDIREQISAN